MEFAIETLALLAAVAFVAGAIDAMAGGGGLLTIPALMSGALAIRLLADPANPIWGWL